MQPHSLNTPLTQDFLRDTVSVCLVKPSTYSTSKTKRGIDMLLSLLLLLLLFPCLLLLAIVIRLNSKGPSLFKQRRTGYLGKTFILWKFRTMSPGSEHLQAELAKYNESPSPTFKIHADPRYTSIGKYLSHTGIDELPQLWNILKGEMSFVGPRPLPLSEAQQLPPSAEFRSQVKPGILSSWVLQKRRSENIQNLLNLDAHDLLSDSFFFEVKLLLTFITSFTA